MTDIDQHDSVQAFVGVHMGRGAHHAVALDRTAIRLLDSASEIHRSSVATDTPISCDTVAIAAPSGGSNRATARSLNTCPNRATVSPQCPKYYRAIEAATTATQGDSQFRARLTPQHRTPKRHKAKAYRTTGGTTAAAQF
jgi:hypothetical protein